MKVTDYKGYEVYMPTSGGKAGKGCNKTSTLQLRKNNCIVAQARFTVDDLASRARAIAKLKKAADDREVEAERAKASMTDAFRTAGY